jgi:hypothetical protein
VPGKGTDMTTDYDDEKRKRTLAERPESAFGTHGRGRQGNEQGEGTAREGEARKRWRGEG